MINLITILVKCPIIPKYTQECIILTKIVTYYSQNNAGILGSGLNGCIVTYNNYSYVHNSVSHLKNGSFGRPSGNMKALSSDCNLLFNILRSLSLQTNKLAS